MYNPVTWAVIILGAIIGLYADTTVTCIGFFIAAVATFAVKSAAHRQFMLYIDIAFITAAIMEVIR